MESTHGRGSSFTVILPAEQDLGGPRTVSEAVAAVAHGEGLVLVIDDEPAVRSLVQRSLEGLGYTSEQLAQAVALARRPDAT